MGSKVTVVRRGVALVVPRTPAITVTPGTWFLGRPHVSGEHNVRPTQLMLKTECRVEFVEAGNPYRSADDVNIYDYLLVDVAITPTIPES
jgi:hypothetical protein